MRRPSSVKSCSIPATAAFTSRMSCDVSMRRRSTPPSIRYWAWSWKFRESSSKVMLPSAGSELDGSMPVGPIDAATNRGFSGVLYLSAAARAILCGGDVDVADLVAESPFFEAARCRLEGAGLDDVARRLRGRTRGSPG